MSLSLQFGEWCVGSVGLLIREVEEDTLGLVGLGLAEEELVGSFTELCLLREGSLGGDRLLY